MNAYTEKLLGELAPVIARLVECEVAKAVDARLQKGEAVLLTWRGRWAPGMVCGEATMVEHHGRAFRALAPTTETPAVTSRDWALVADAPH